MDQLLSLVYLLECSELASHLVTVLADLDLMVVVVAYSLLARD